MKKDSGPYKKIKIYCYIVGLTAFLTAFFVGIFLLHNLEKNEKTTGKYMAQRFSSVNAQPISQRTFSWSFTQIGRAHV